MQIHIEFDHIMPALRMIYVVRVCSRSFLACSHPPRAFSRARLATKKPCMFRVCRVVQSYEIKLKFVFSKKTTKIDEIFTVNLTLTKGQ